MSNEPDANWTAWRIALLRFAAVASFVVLVLVMLARYLKPDPPERQVSTTAVPDDPKLIKTVKEVAYHITTNLNPPPMNSAKWVPKFYEIAVTNKVLKAMSETNAAFQAWGKEFMLSNVNAFLAKVPFYGLEAPLDPSQLKTHSYLTYNGAQLWLATKDNSHTMLYELGVLCSVEAPGADYLGLSRNPEKENTWHQNIGPWSEREAAAEAQKILDKLGISRWKAGLSGPKVKPFEMEHPSDPSNQITPFYTVEFHDDGGTPIGIHFRRNAEGKWLPTYWFNNLRNPSETVSQDMPALYRRFFSDTD